MVEKIIIAVEHDGESWLASFHFEDPCYVDISLDTVFDYGDRNYSRHGLIGNSFAYTVLIFRIFFKVEEQEHFLVLQQNKRSPYSENSEYEFKIGRDRKVWFEIDAADDHWVQIMSPEQLEEYLTYTEEFAEA